MLELPTDARLIHRMYESFVKAIYETELSAGDAFIDLGANVGHHTWQMGLCVGEQGRGFAIEPVPDFAERVKNVLANKSIGWVEVLNVAAADYEGECSFYIQPDHIGWSSMFSDHRHPGDAAEDAQEITVPVSTLDAKVVLEDSQKLSAIKIDVENAEFAALRGARSLLEIHKPAVVFENSPAAAAKRAGYEVADFFDFFDSLGYELWSLHGVKMASAAEWAASKSSYYAATPASFQSEESFVEHYDLIGVRDRLLAES